MKDTWIDKTLSTMSMEEKVGQLLMVGFFSISEGSLPEMTAAVKNYNLGGIFHFALSQKVLSKCLGKIQEAVKIPVLVGCDYECGPGWVIDEGLRIPRAMARGDSGNAEQEYLLGKMIARQGRSMGAMLTFSPVIDLNTHHLNPDVNIRAYGEDVNTVTRLAIPYIKGIQENGMLAGVKHFPGNGGTDMDQHINTAIIPFSSEEMERTCLETYRRVFWEAEAAAVMVAHLEVPSMVTEKNPKTGRLVPASLSYEVVTEQLRNRLGFTGLAVTDAMNMGGVASQYTRAEAAVKAVQAGIDMLLVFNPENFEIEYNAILEAVRGGEITQERLEDAVRRVLETKVKAGLHLGKAQPECEEEREKIFSAGVQQDGLCRDILQKGITLLRNRGQILPITGINGKRAAVISTYNPDRETFVVQGQPAQMMADITPQLLKERGALVEAYEMSLHMETDKIYEVLEKARQCDYVFYNFFIAPSWGIGTLIPNKSALRLFMYGIMTMEKPLIVTAFGDPYVMYYCPAAPVYMCTYDETANAQQAAVRAWLGEAPVTGRSPVSLEGMFKRGDGIKLDGTVDCR